MQDENHNDIESLQRQSKVILDSLSEGIYGLDSDYRVTYFNQSARFLLGWEFSEVVGKFAHSLFHHSRKDGSQKPFSECPLSWLETGGFILNIEDLMWRKDGTAFYAEVSVVELANNAGETKTVVLFRDITERKENREALLRSNEELVAMNAKLEEAHHQLLQAERLASVGQLAAGIAHEINNPIGFVQSNLGSLERYVNAMLGLLDNYEELEKGGGNQPNQSW